jgi:hypothetical protein
MFPSFRDVESFWRNPIYCPAAGRLTAVSVQERAGRDPSGVVLRFFVFSVVFAASVSFSRFSFFILARQKFRSVH